MLSLVTSFRSIPQWTQFSSSEFKPCRNLPFFVKLQSSVRRSYFEWLCASPNWSQTIFNCRTKVPHHVLVTPFDSYVTHDIVILNWIHTYETPVKKWSQLFAIRKASNVHVSNILLSGTPRTRTEATITYPKPKSLGLTSRSHTSEHPNCALPLFLILFSLFVHALSKTQVGLLQLGK